MACTIYDAFMFLPVFIFMPLRKQNVEPGGRCDEHRGGFADDRRDLLCYRPRVLQAEGLQSQDGNGLARGQPHLSGLYCYVITEVLGIHFRHTEMFWLLS